MAQPSLWPGQGQGQRRDRRLRARRSTAGAAVEVTLRGVAVTARAARRLSRRCRGARHRLQLMLARPRRVVRRERPERRWRRPLRQYWPVGADGDSHTTKHHSTLHVAADTRDRTLAPGVLAAIEQLREHMWRGGERSGEEGDQNGDIRHVDDVTGRQDTEARFARCSVAATTAAQASRFPHAVTAHISPSCDVQRRPRRAPERPDPAQGRVATARRQDGRARKERTCCCFSRRFRRCSCLACDRSCRLKLLTSTVAYGHSVHLKGFSRSGSAL